MNERDIYRLNRYGEEMTDSFAAIVNGILDAEDVPTALKASRCLGRIAKQIEDGEIEEVLSRFCADDDNLPVALVDDPDPLDDPTDGQAKPNSRTDDRPLRAG